MNVKCKEVFASCRCRLRRHEPTGPHECRCGGSWVYDNNGDFDVVRYPGGEDD